MPLQRVVLTQGSKYLLLEEDEPVARRRLRVGDEIVICMGGHVWLSESWEETLRGTCPLCPPHITTGESEIKEKAPYYPVPARRTLSPWLAGLVLLVVFLIGRSLFSGATIPPEPTAQPTNPPTAVASHVPTATSTFFPASTVEPTALVTALSQPTKAALPTPIRIADLVLVEFRTEPNRPIIGQPYQKVFVIRNIGTARAESCSVHIDWSDGRSGDFQVGPLNPGESAKVARAGGTFSSSELTRVGHLTVDYYNKVPESNELNNETNIQYAYSAPKLPSPHIGGPLSVKFDLNSKRCVNSGKYALEYTVYADGGKPPYTYYRDTVDQKISGATNGGIFYSVIWNEQHPAIGTFIVIDSAGKRSEKKFFEDGLKC